MYAVVEIAGKQFKVAENDKIVVPAMKEKAGAKISFDKVLMLGGEEETAIGNPAIAGAQVEATVLDHPRGEELVVFKKKKRKGYRVKRGHRQGYTRVEITKISR